MILTLSETFRYHLLQVFITRNAHMVHIVFKSDLKWCIQLSKSLFLKFQCFNQKGMHFIHINARSILPKMSELRVLACHTTAAVISVSETGLDATITDAEVSIDGYSVIRKDRKRSGGGAACS